MKRKSLGLIVFSLLLSSILFSCNTYKEIFPDIAKIKIVIYNFDGEDYSIEITDDKEIKTITRFITDVSSPKYKCMYNGKIEFYCKNNNLLLDAEFNTDCNTIAFVYGDKLFTKRISKDGIDYIENMIHHLPK